MTRLQQLRMDQVLTPEQLADEVTTDVCPVSARTIRRIEKGESTNLRTLGVLGLHELPLRRTIRQASRNLAEAHPPSVDLIDVSDVDFDWYHEREAA